MTYVAFDTNVCVCWANQLLATCHAQAWQMPAQLRAHHCPICLPACHAHLGSRCLLLRRAWLCKCVLSLQPVNN